MDAGVGLNGLRIARMRSIIGRMPVVPRLLPPMPGRALAVLPDFATAVACLVVWIRPFAFGANGVKTIVLMMLMEFLLVHGTGFFTQVAFADAAGKGGRLLMMAGLLLFYVVDAAAIDYLVLTILFLMIFGFEALNTAIEELVDRVSPEVSQTGKHAKDLGSFGVFCALTAAGLYMAWVALGRHF